MSNETRVKRSYYYADCDEFLNASEEAILGELTDSHMPLTLTVQQEQAWKEEIRILKQVMRDLGDGHVAFEYTIPRMGKRIDAVIIKQGHVFLLEFKVFETEYPKTAVDQVVDYALDLHNFQEGSRDVNLFPIAVCTEAPNKEDNVEIIDKVATPLRCNRHNLSATIRRTIDLFPTDNLIDANEWFNSVYKPTPTIIEAAQALYRNHNVADITRNDAEDLTVTTETIKSIIAKSKAEKKKSIIFVTGVPGAGKTLVGLNLAIESYNRKIDDRAVFLSGNHPLVSVIREALIRDRVNREAENEIKISKKEAERKLNSGIQMIYKYRDYHFGNDIIPDEKIAIFDESQRAWTNDEMASFMRKNNKIRPGATSERDLCFSEPGFLISTMDRHEGWAVVVCLVGGGQEINRGEAGMPEWFDSLREHFSHWDVYATEQINDKEYLRERTWQELVSGLNLHVCPELHLSASMRSFRSEKVADFVKKLLDNDTAEAAAVFKSIKDKYPIYITRDLDTAKNWVRTISRGNERYGLFASSNAARLKPRGVVYARDRNSISPENWFLNGKDDIRSSYFLEAVASEFETQGLELDYAIVAWDADFRIENGRWCHYQMSTRLTPPNWSPIRSEDNITYLTNAYRVLLTRARQGFIIYLPEGVDDDKTREPRFYDETFKYLKSIGIEEI